MTIKSTADRLSAKFSKQLDLGKFLELGGSVSAVVGLCLSEECYRHLNECLGTCQPRE